MPSPLAKQLIAAKMPGFRIVVLRQQPSGYKAAAGAAGIDRRVAANAETDLSRLQSKYGVSRKSSPATKRPAKLVNDEEVVFIQPKSDSRRTIRIRPRAVIISHRAKSIVGVQG